MGKGSARFGHKSGVLPEVRQIFKNPIKPVVRPANRNTGYAEGVQHPRGSTREQPLPKVKTVSDLINKTVKEPRQIPDLQKLNEIEKEKVTKAALRREYYIQALQKEEKKLQARETREQNQAKEEAQKKAEEVHEISEATRLTLPTIDSLLEGPFMRQRTEEENQILEAKRTANRIKHELIGKTNRAVRLLELYYDSEKFITNEEDLKDAIEAAFSKNGNDQNIFVDPEHKIRSNNEILQDALFGTLNSNPGLIQINETLSGEAAKFNELVTEVIEEAEEKNKQEIRDLL